jgi:hypothetical protein
MLEYVIGGAGILAAAGGASAICYFLNRVNQNLIKVTDSLSVRGDNNQKTGTVLLPVTRMDPKAECNTVLPLPMGAELCNHSMDVLTSQVIRAPHEEKCVIILLCSKCGAIDKTIAVTSPPPKPPPPPPEPLPPRSECRHDWVKEKTVTLQSAFEQMEELLKKQQDANKSKTQYPYTRTGKKDEQQQEVSFDAATAPSWMFQKKICLQRICSKCGEIDRAIVSNFDIEEENGKRVDETEAEKPE